MALGVTRAGVGSSVSSAEIVNDSIVNADVNASAAVAVSKLAHPSVGTRFHVAPNLSNSSALRVADRLEYAAVIVPWNATLTGIGYWVGAVGTAGSVRCALYDAAGTRVANRTSNASVASANTWQQVAFDSTYGAVPGLYFASLIWSSGTDTAYTGATIGLAGVAAQGGFETPSSITPPTTTSLAPLMATY